MLIIYKFFIFIYYKMDGLTVCDLKIEARKQGLKNYSKLKRVELIKLIADNMALSVEEFKALTPSKKEKKKADKKADKKVDKKVEDKTIKIKVKKSQKKEIKDLEQEVKSVKEKTKKVEDKVKKMKKK